MIKILIVEDDAIVATDMVYMVESFGYKVSGVASSAHTANNLFISDPPNLVLCDINLGYKKDGIDFAIKAKKILDVPFVFVTAYTDEVTLAKAVTAEPDAYLTKPFTKLQLEASINLALRKIKHQKLTTKKIESESKLQMPSDREMQIILYVVDGYSSSKIAKKLGISFETVQTHRKNILKKYKLTTSAELIALAVKNKWK